MCWAEAPSLRPGMVTLFFTSTWSQWSPNIPALTPFHPRPVYVIHKVQLMTSFWLDLRSFCLFFTVWTEASKVAPSAALSREGLQVADSHCSGLLLVFFFFFLNRLWLWTDWSQELLFYPDFPMIPRDRSRHAPNPVLLVVGWMNNT